MYKEIKIDQVKSNPNNPRASFEGPKFDDLMKSIKEKGVLEPILVRPVDGKFEIVAGERRFRALRKICESGDEPLIALKDVVIPTIVRKLTDHEAFEIMIIENLQREDLTPFEEARSFEKYAKKHGKDGIQSLGERTGILPAYIRRRIAILRLPKRALDAWDKGTLTFGHLEELIRLKDPQDLKETIGRILDQQWRKMTVKDLRNHINSMIPLLTKAKFDKTECSNCMQNSDVQKKLWDIESMKKTHCLNPKCFKKKQVDFLTKNWAETPWAKRFKTTGFAFHQDLQWDDHNEFYPTPFKKCLDGCKNFKTIISLDGTLDEGQSCVKNKACFQSLSRSKAQKGREKKDDGGPRVNWHGQHFREEFFKERIPEQFKIFSPDDVKMLRAAVYAMIQTKWTLCERFFELSDIKSDKNGDFYDVEKSQIFDKIKKMKREKLLQIIQELSLLTILSSDVDAEGRWLMANHIGIDLAKEWSPPEDFYQMKTIRGLLEYGDKIGIFLDKKAIKFLQEKIKRKKFSACKKSELVQVFKDSGIDLTGKVPDEILGEGKK